MAILSKKNTNQCSVPCLIGKWTVAVITFLAAVAALVGVYETHVIASSDGAMALQFGSTGGSLALIALTLASIGWCKQMVLCMSKYCDVCN